MFREQFCKTQLLWLSSIECQVIGIVSVIGSQLSLFSMTVLSIIRCKDIGDMNLVGKEAGPRFKLKLSAICILLLLVSAMISCIPLLPAAADFFVNGLVYDTTNTLFVGSSNKATHFDVIAAYFGRVKNTMLSWAQTDAMIMAMFSNDHNGIKFNHINFYGNDPVCPFKFFVTSHDPQRMYVWAVLSFDFLCVLTISCSYLSMLIKVNNSFRKIKDLSGTARTGDKGRERMQRKIGIIILTDLLCWLPFLLICILHSLEKIDASSLYLLFSILILPINSVINPLIYSNKLLDLLRYSKVIVLERSLKLMRFVPVLDQDPGPGPGNSRDWPFYPGPGPGPRKVFIPAPAIRLLSRPRPRQNFRKVPGLCRDFHR